MVVHETDRMAANLIETIIVVLKVSPAVFLAGFALAPVSSAEDILLRTAAGVGATTLIWRTVFLPIQKFIAARLSEWHETRKDIRDVKLLIVGHIGDPHAHGSLDIR